MTRRLVRLAACALLLLTAAPPAAVRADDDAALRRAQRHFYRGEKLFALGRFAEALSAYEAAFEAKPLPELLFNIGQCHRNLGNHEDAIFSFRKYLQLLPDAANREAVEKLIGDLERERAAALEEARRRRLRLGERPPPPPRKSGGLHTRWWFWTGLGVAAAAAGTAAYFALDQDSALPSSDLGNLDFAQ